MTNQIEVPITANIAGLEAGMTNGAKSVEEGALKIEASLQKVMSDFAILNHVTSGNVKSFEELAVAEGAVAKIQQEGAASADLLTVATARLKEAESALAKGATKATVALEAQNVAQKTVMGNSRVMAEVTTIMSEIMSGNFGRIRRSAAALANQSGLLQKVFSPVGLGIGAVAVAAGVLVYQLYEAQKVEAEFNSTLLLTNYAAGISLDGMNRLAASIRGANGDMGRAQEATMAVVKSGKFMGDQLLEVGKAAAEMGHMTGQSAKDVVKEFAKIKEDPVKAVLKLNEEMHFLTLATLDQMQKMEQLGKVDEAAKVGIDALAGFIHQAAVKEEEDAGNVLTAWEKTKSFFSKVKADIFDWGTEHQKLQALRDRAKEIETNLKDTGFFAWHGAARVAGQQQLIALNKEIAEQDAKMAATKKAAEDKGVEDARVDRAGKLTLEVGKYVDKLKDEFNLTNQLKLARKALEDDHRDNPNDPKLQGVKFDDKGAISGGDTWLALVKKLTKEYGEVGKKAKGAGAAARLAARDAMSALQEQRDQAKAHGFDLMKIDQEIVNAAKANAKKRPEAYRQALKQMEDDEKAFVKTVEKLGKEELKEDMKADEDRLAEARATYNDQAEIKKSLNRDAYRDGSISADELRALNKQLDRDIEANDKAYFLALAAMRGNDILAGAEADKSIAKSHDDSLKRQLKADEEYHANVRAEWRQTGQQIASSMSNTLTGVLTGQTTIKQALLGLGKQALSDFIHFETQKLVMSQINNKIKIADDAAAAAATSGIVTGAETVKTGAVVAGAAMRTAAETTAAATVTTVNAATASKSIIASAYAVFGKVYSAIADIPYVGPILAPIAAAAALATVIGMVSKVASAEKGWGRVPFDGMPAELHKDEMVLPAQYADVIRKLGDSRGRAGVQNAGNITIYASDSKSFADTLRRNPSGLMRGLRNAGLLGHTAGIVP